MIGPAALLVKLNGDLSDRSPHETFAIFPGVHPTPTPRLVTQFREQYRKILLDHTLEQCKFESIDQANRQVALSDVRAVVAQLERTSSDQEYDSTLKVQGYGGTLRIHLQKKNPHSLRILCLT